MKRLLIIAAIILLAVPAMAQTWYNANQGTFLWDAVTKLSDGTNIPAGSTIKYQAYRKLSPATVGEKIGGEGTALQAVITFSSEGSYFVGVEALRYVGTTLVSRSATISYSDVAVNCQGGTTFGFQYWLPLGSVMGLRPQTTP